MSEQPPPPVDQEQLAPAMAAARLQRQAYRNYHGTGSFAGMEEAAAASLDANQAIAAKQAAEEAAADQAREFAKAKRQAIEARRNSQEVSLLNDRAEFEIYGSQGRTYHNPVTGEVIATPEKPAMGIVMAIRSNRRYGRTEDERNQAADTYLSDVQKLLGKGLELTQAKLVMDLRGERGERLAKQAKLLDKLALQYARQGNTVIQSRRLAKGRLKNRLIDERREEADLVKLLKTEGIFDILEYDKYDERPKGSSFPVQSAAVHSVAELHGPNVGTSPRAMHGPALPDVESNFNTDKLKKLDSARNLYAELTAKRRSNIVGGKDDLEKAQAEYESARNLVLHSIHESSKDDFSELLRPRLIMENLIVETHRLETAIYDARIRLAEGKRLSKFYDWWARQGGAGNRRGTIKKAATMAGIGAVIGITLAPVLTFLGTGVVGGIAAGSLARGVARGLARGKIEHNAADTPNVASAQSLTHSLHTIDLIRNTFTDRGNEAFNLDATVLTNEADSHTTSEVRRNRKRMLGAVALGAASGLVGGLAIGALSHYYSFWPWGGGGHTTEHPWPWGGDDHTTGHPTSTSTPTDHATAPTTTSPAAQQPGGPGSQAPPDSHPAGRSEHLANPPGSRHLVPPAGAAFRVENGSGIIKEIGEYAHDNGHNLSPMQTQQVYEAARARFGRHIIDLIATQHDTYMQGGDIRLAQPGLAHWFPGVEAFLQDELKKS